MSTQIYTRGRNVINETGVYENIKAELITLFKANKALLDQRLDLAEEYSYSGEGFKTLTETCEPIRMLECNHLIIKNDIVVGSVILRVNNNKPTHGILMLQDCLERTYELRFKTFAGCDFTVESSGIAISQRNVGAMLINSGCGTGFADQILKRHWEEFKSLCTFTEDEIKNPTKLRTWSQRFAVYAGE